MGTGLHFTAQWDSRAYKWDTRGGTWVDWGTGTNLHQPAPISPPRTLSHFLRLQGLADYTAKLAAASDDYEKAGAYTPLLSTST